MAGKQPEILLNKADVDRTFSFNKTQWAEAASQMIAPGWTLRSYEHESGTQVIGYDPSTGIGLSVQPYFKTETSLPEIVIVGNYFPVGMFPPLTDELKLEIELVAQKQLGEAYSLRLIHKITDNIEMFDFMISEL